MLLPLFLIVFGNSSTPIWELVGSNKSRYEDDSRNLKQAVDNV